MESNPIDNYIKTDISFITQSPDIKENNFISIINLYNNQNKNNIISNKISENQTNFLEMENNFPSGKFYNNDNENNKDLDDSMNEKSKTVEISASGSVQIKNNKLIQNKNLFDFNDNNNNNILDIDDKAEDMLINNNLFFSNHSSSNKQSKNNINLKNDNNSEFKFQDIPLNINDEEYKNKWKKLSILYIEKFKKDNLYILDRLINSKKNKIEIVEINKLKEKDKIKKVKSRNDTGETNEDVFNIRNSYNNNINNIRDSTDSRASYENLTNIITTTQINNLTNSSDLKNTINNINININNAKLIIPTVSKYSDESDNLSSKRNNYQKTDISNILSINNILNVEEFKNVIDFLKYKDELYNKKLNNNDYNDSANVRVSLDSGVKKKDYNNISIIKEEENESYDSLSLQKSVRNSGKVTPNKMDIKKNSFKDKKDFINNQNSQNNFYNNINDAFNNNELLNNNKVIEEINIGNEDDKIDDNVISNINSMNKNNRKNKIMSIDVDMNNNDSKKNDELNNNIEINHDMDISEDEKNENELEKKGDEYNKEEEKKDIVNYSTPESKEKTIEKKYESVKDNMNKKNEPKEFNNFENDNNENNVNLQFSDFNNIINNKEENQEDNKEEENQEESQEDNNIENEKENQEDNIIENNNIKDTNIIEDNNIKASNIEDNNIKSNYIEDNNIKNNYIEDKNIEDNKKDNEKDIIEENKEDIEEDNEEDNIEDLEDNLEDNKEKEKDKEGIDKLNNKKKEIIKRIIIKNDENIENEDTYKKPNINNGKKYEEDYEIKNKNNAKTEEKIILSESAIKNSLKDSIINQHLKSPEASLIDFNKEKEDKKKIKLFEIESNSNNSINKTKKNDNLANELLDYQIIDENNNIVLFTDKNNIIKNNTCKIPLKSYIYILQLCLGKKLLLKIKYDFFITKLLKMFDKNKKGNNSKNIPNNKDNENKINNDIINFKKKLKYLKKLYIYLITKENNLNSEKEKEKLKGEIDISKKEKEEVSQLFNGIIAQIKSSNQFNIYKDTIKKILKKNEKIKEKELDEAEDKMKQNNLNFPKKDIYLDNNHIDYQNINSESKGCGNFIFFILTILIPFLFIFYYLFTNSKSDEKRGNIIK